MISILYNILYSILYNMLYRILYSVLNSILAVACGVLGHTATPRADAGARGGLWRRKNCDCRAVAWFGNAIHEIHHTKGQGKGLRWPVRFAEGRDSTMGGLKVSLTFNPLAKLYQVDERMLWYHGAMVPLSHGTILKCGHGMIDQKII